MTEHQFLQQVFLPFVDANKPLKNAAEKLDVDLSYISHIQAGRRPITRKIAARLGYELVETNKREYVKVDK